jgi:alcohol dehydrogenase (NADP+)
VCHTDVHETRNDWHSTSYPIVPGHEIVGRVRATGSRVTRFVVGDLVGIGAMVDSCRHCEACVKSLQQYCHRGPTFTYNSKNNVTGEVTYGGYSDSLVVNEDFVLRVPSSLNPAAAAPLMCAGVTMYSALRHYAIGAGMKIGIVGLGGLGHMGVKLAVAMGAEVAVFTTSLGKTGDALRLGATEVLTPANLDAVTQHARNFDLLVSTIGSVHDVNPYLELLKRDGSYVIVGALEPIPTVRGNLLASRRIAVAGSFIGGIAETQEVLDFCGERGIAADIELIPIQDINSAFDRVVAKDVRYRFVIDMASIHDRAGTIASRR